MQTIDHADDRSAAFAASICLALLQAEYPAADPVIVEAAAVRLASSHCIEAAIGDGWVMQESMIQRDAVSLLYRYKAALVEAGRPDLIAARFTLWASDQDASADYHERTRADFAARLEIRRADRGWWLMSIEEIEGTVSASERCRDDARAKAIGYRARAAELSVRAAA